MEQTELDFDIDIRDWEPDWEAVARMFAEQLARTAEFDEALERLERDASWKLRQAAKSDFADDDWVPPYAAATMLREARDAHPDWAEHRENARQLRDLRAAKRAEAEAEREDPVELVLIAPRRRQNVIERIVETQSGRVCAEYRHEGGWRRHRIDLRTILTGTPISRRRAIYDHLPTEECLAQMRLRDPDCIISGPTPGAARGGAIAVPYQ